MNSVIEARGVEWAFWKIKEVFGFVSKKEPNILVAVLQAQTN